LNNYKNVPIFLNSHSQETMKEKYLSAGGKRST